MINTFSYNILHGQSVGRTKLIDEVFFTFQTEDDFTDNTGMAALSMLCAVPHQLGLFETNITPLFQLGVHLQVEWVRYPLGT